MCGGGGEVMCVWEGGRGEVVCVWGGGIVSSVPACWVISVEDVILLFFVCCFVLFLKGAS